MTLDDISIKSLLVNLMSVSGINLRQPTIADAGLIWCLAKRSKSLDLNSFYAYLLWCRDFSASSMVAHAGADLVGFVTGYVRPDTPATLMIWQVGVCGRFRRTGVATDMLDTLLKEVPGVRAVEATVTDDNVASHCLFAALAARWRVPIEKEVLFAADAFPLPHGAEWLYRIGPFSGDDGSV